MCLLDCDFHSQARLVKRKEHVCLYIYYFSTLSTTTQKATTTLFILYVQYLINCILALLLKNHIFCMLWCRWAVCHGGDEDCDDEAAVKVQDWGKQGDEAGAEEGGPVPLELWPDPRQHLPEKRGISHRRIIKIEASSKVAERWFLVKLIKPQSSHTCWAPSYTDYVLVYYATCTIPHT